MVIQERLIIGALDSTRLYISETFLKKIHVTSRRSKEHTYQFYGGNVTIISSGQTLGKVSATYLLNTLY